MTPLMIVYSMTMLRMYLISIFSVCQHFGIIFSVMAENRYNKLEIAIGKKKKSGESGSKYICGYRINKYLVRNPQHPCGDSQEDNSED